ncbi:MAG: competence protein ComEA [Bacteroidetes bacterium HGW-Bacteroidetes-2]|jgi:DNA uptake protein ComE-like DNA-binding protein|nr:MAG: competence protein ComEA [Bacteroidetes bacterium HGW-Bacteroidetes-2]
MKSSSSHFRFSRKQRNGILLLVIVIIILQCVYFFVDFSYETLLETNTSEIITAQRQIDSLKQATLQERQPIISAFNPNFITEYKGYTLGMSIEEMERLQQFRKKDQWINSVADFKRVTQVSDSLLDAISPYFQFPEWVTNPNPKTNSWLDKPQKSFVQKTDLNKATQEQLEEINGIGEVLSKRIIDYRTRLNGFLTDEQLYDVYGLEASVVKRIIDEFTVKEKPQIEKININKASASDIATLPFINFQLAKEIVDYRMLHEGIKSFDELKNISGFPAQKIERFILYLALN